MLTCINCKYCLACFVILVVCGVDVGDAIDDEDVFRIKALQRARDPAGVCSIQDLETIADSEDVLCEGVVRSGFAESRTKCRVNEEDITYQEYICDNGIWKVNSGTTARHSRHKRWFGWLLAAVLVSVIFCALNDKLEWNCEEKKVDPDTLEAPKYTYCPASGEVYTAASKKKTFPATWSDPQATDNDGTPSNEQTCCDYMKGDEFPGLPDDGRKHTVTYTATDKYDMSETCSFWFRVKYITCDTQEYPSNGRRVSCSHDNIYGSECNYACNDGYEMVASSDSTCQSDGTWDNSPACQKLLCQPPFALTNGQVTCDDPTYPYDDDCTFTCNDGFKLIGPLKMTCQANQIWSVDVSQVSCVDDEPPEISCQLNQGFYADFGTFGTSVTWIEPTVTDNVDSNPTITQTSGPTQGDVLLEGKHFVAYRADDVTGNSVPALSECTITLEVIVIKCSTGPTDALDVSSFMTYNCSDTTFYNGVSCTLGCDLNLPLNGTDLMTCERDGTTDQGVWSWGSGYQPFCEVVECPPLTAPGNGSYAMDSINARPVRIMLCKSGFDSPIVGASFLGRLSCQDSGTWFPLPAFPDCVVKSPLFMVLPSELIYDGDCNDEATQDQIKQQVLEYLSGVKADVDQSICPDPETCKIENLIVVCGADSGRRKRRSDGHDIRKRQAGLLIATFDIKVEFDLGNRTVNEVYLEALGVLTDISDTIQDAVSNGDFNISGFILHNDAYQADFSMVGLVCDPGSKLDTSVLKCKPCPPGTYLNSTTGNCEQCNVGEYMDHAGAVQCDPCPEGYSTLSTGSKNLQNCTKLCSPGYYSSSTMVPCSACPVGQYQPLQGQSDCDSCPVGLATNTTNSVSVDECLPFDLSLTQTTIVGAFDANGANVLSMSVWLKLGRGNIADISITTADTGGSILTLGGSPTISFTPNDGTAIQTDKMLSADHWTHVMVTVDFGSASLQAYIDGVLVVDETGLSIDQTRTVSDGETTLISNSNGIYISGLVLYGRHFSLADMTSHSQICDVSAGDEILSMSQFLQNIVEGAGVITPTTCDPIDECAGEPCGIHTCVNMVGDFECICRNGMTGDLCDIPPDYCQGHTCQHGDCIPGNRTYSCSCSSGYTGVFCDIPPVDGGWSLWSEWSGCDVTCGGGLHVRTRNCTEPAPGDMGQDCTGESVQIETCNDNICLTCPDFNREIGTVRTCTDNIEDNVKECNLTCIRGNVLANGQRPFEKYWCGHSTNYTWFPIDKTPECVVPARPDRLGAIITVGYTTTVPSSDEPDLASSVDQNLSNMSCVKSGTCESRTSVSTGSRKRRSTSSTLSVEFSIQLTDNGDLDLADYLTDGTESSAMTELLNAVSALNEAVEFIQNNTETIFNVNIGGVAYSIDDSLSSYSATVTCESGYAGADGLCALCAPGTKLNYPACENCDLGTYQPQYGQDSCLPCPAGYTTVTYGATDVSECSVVTSVTASTITTEESTSANDEEKTENIKTIIIVVIAMSSVAFLLSMVAIGVLTWRKCIRRRFRHDGRAGSVASLGMVRPECATPRDNQNYRTTFNFKTRTTSFGASFTDNPPAYDSHNFFQAPPVFNKDNKMTEKCQDLEIVDC